QAASADLTGHRLAGHRAQSIVAELEADVLELEQPLVLFDDSVFRPRQDFHQRGLVQIFERPDDRHAAHKLGNQAELNEILRLHIRKQFRFHLLVSRQDFASGFFFAGTEPKRLLAGTAANDLLKADKSATANE